MDTEKHPLSINSFHDDFILKPALLEKYFRKAQNWARNKHKVPLEIRREAYEKSGRLAKDPDCLDLYGDL